MCPVIINTGRAVPVDGPEDRFDLQFFTPVRVIYVTAFHIAAGTAIIATAPTVGALASRVSGGIFAILLIHIGNPATYIRGTLINKPRCYIIAFNALKCIHLLFTMNKRLPITF